MLSLWINAELFYATYLPIIVVVLLFISIFYLIAVFYTKKRTKLRKIAHLIFLGMIVASSLYVIFGHRRYNFWIEQNQYTNPGIRTQRVVLGITFDEEPLMAELDRNSSSLSERLSQLDIYESTEVKEAFPYPYLGSISRSHYFAFGDENQYPFRVVGELNWTEDERALVGKTHVLKEEQFESIGFINDYPILFESISLPREEQRELEESFDTRSLYPVEDMYTDWIFYNY